MLKENFSIERADLFLKNNLPFPVSITIRSNLLDSNRKWLDVDKDYFVGVRVSFFSDKPIVNSYVPNFFARAFFGGLISGVFHHSARNQFEKQVKSLLLNEFYENSTNSSFSYSGGHNSTANRSDHLSPKSASSVTINNTQSEPKNSINKSSYKSGDLYK